MNRLPLIKFVLLSLCVFALSAPAVFAAETITIDTQFLTPDTNATSVPEFIARFYELGLGIAGIIAVGMIVVGAIFYTISGASPQKKGEAKDIIFSALWGVVLLFGSYLILKSINPQLIDLRDP
jgi:RsiW-degrading membrane proteinase PrsW (M82 family)